SARLGKIADGHFQLALDGAAVSGKLHLELAKLPFLKERTNIDAEFKNNQLSTRPIALEFDDSVAKHVDGHLEVQLLHNHVKVSGAITRLKGLGKLGERVRNSSVAYNDEAGEIDIHGTLDVSGVPGIKEGSQLTVGVDAGQLYAKGDLSFAPKGK